MATLRDKWQETKRIVAEEEQKTITVFIAFLRATAKEFLRQGRRVAFRENKVVHYGEGGFGSLIIEGNDAMFESFGDYVPEIRFEADFNGVLKRGCVEIKEENITDITYSSYV